MKIENWNYTVYPWSCLKHHTVHFISRTFLCQFGQVSGTLPYCDLFSFSLFVALASRHRSSSRQAASWWDAPTEAAAAAAECGEPSTSSSLSSSPSGRLSVCQAAPTCPPYCQPCLSCGCIIFVPEAQMRWKQRGLESTFQVGLRGLIAVWSNLISFKQCVRPFTSLRTFQRCGQWWHWSGRGTKWPFVASTLLGCPSLGEVDNFTRPLVGWLITVRLAHLSFGR